MNALTRAAAAALPRATAAQFRATSAVQRRQASTGAVGGGTFAQNWLSDPSTYPILGILIMAVGGCSAFMTYKITRSPDVRIGKNTKGQVVRTWHN